MFKLASLIVMLFVQPGWAANLIDVKNYQDEGRFVSELIFDGPMASDSLKVDFINETIQIDIPGAELKKGRVHKTVKDAMVRSTFTYQLDDETLRSRIIYKGVPAVTFTDKVKLESGQNSLKIVVGDKTSAPVAEQSEKRAPAQGAPPQGLTTKKENPIKDPLNSNSEDELLSQINSEIEERALEPDLTMSKEEESIPVLLPEAPAAEASTNPYMRLMMSLGIIAVIGLGVLVFFKRIKNTSAQAPSGTQIKVLTQHYLGPKKSLAIVRVAGESVLIGITDHNITMIKSLSLLDEEVPEEVPRDFGGVLGKLWERDAKGKGGRNEAKAKAKKKADADGDDDFSIEGIKDIVSSRLKDMRSID